MHNGSNKNKNKTSKAERTGQNGTREDKWITLKQDDRRKVHGNVRDLVLGEKRVLK